VHCVIIGLGKKIREKYILDGERYKQVKNISPYLIEGDMTFVKKRSKPLSKFPVMGIGNKPIDDGNYLFTDDERNEFIRREPKSAKYFYRWYGGREYSTGAIRWCLLPQRISETELKSMPEVQELIENVRMFRLESSSKPTIKLADTPRNFHVEKFPQSSYMVIQKVSTGIREYLPVGFFEATDISSDLLNVIDSSDLTIFAAISSKMHMVWMSAVGGRFRDGFRYSSSLCYNTFPFPEINKSKKTLLESLSFELLDEREKYTEMTLAELYDPKTMPDSLKNAHCSLDIAVEQCYRAYPFKSDEERLEYLFKLYEEMTAAESK
jgi:hypothetical protein